VASKAAWNDLKLLQQLQSFPDRDISEATSRKLAGQLWYLSKDLILFALFDSNVDVTTKWDILKASIEKGGELLKHAEIQRSSVQQKTLADFVSKRSRTVFMTLGLPDGVVDPKLWTTRDDYKAAEAIVNTLSVTNDHVERGVALIQDAVHSQDASRVKHSYSMRCKSSRKTELNFQTQRSRHCLRKQTDSQLLAVNC